MEIQSKGELFAVPLELREGIYAYLLPYGVHLWHQDDVLRVSECTQPSSDGVHRADLLQRPMM